MCQSDPRIHLSGSDRNCDLTIYNVTSSDYGPWMCLVHDSQDFDTDKSYIDIDIGLRARVTLQVTPTTTSSYDTKERVVRVLEGTSVDIRCETDRANPKPSFIWTGPQSPDSVTMADNRLAVMRKYVGSNSENTNNWRGNITITKPVSKIWVLGRLQKYLFISGSTQLPSH